MDGYWSLVIGPSSAIASAGRLWFLVAGLLKSLSSLYSLKIVAQENLVF